MVSARRPASSIPASEVRISGGIFLLSLTYWSNCASTARRMASTSLSARSSTGIRLISATNSARWSSMRSTRARCTPSTSTLTVPSGSLSICRMLARQPISYMSSGTGSSLAADFCATSRMFLPASMAVSSALIDLGRPTNSGITMCGNTTTSRKGNSGRDWVSTGEAGRPDIIVSFGYESRPPHGGGGPVFKAALPPVKSLRGNSVGTRHLGLVGVDHQRLGAAFDRALVDHDLAHVLQGRQSRTWCRAARFPVWSAGRERRSCASGPCWRWPAAPMGALRVPRLPSQTASDTA